MSKLFVTTTAFSRGGQEARSIKIGSAELNPDGTLTVTLDVLPVNGKLEVRAADGKVLRVAEEGESKAPVPPPRQFKPGDMVDHVLGNFRRGKVIFSSVENNGRVLVSVAWLNGQQNAYWSEELEFSPGW